MAMTMGLVSLLAWLYGSHWFMLAMIGGFAFLAPLSCIGLYAIRAQLERGETPLLSRSLRAAFKRHLGNEMIFALALVVIFMVWARAGMMVSIFLPESGNPDLAELARFFDRRLSHWCIFRHRNVFGQCICAADDHSSRCRQHYRDRYVDQCCAA